MRFAFLSTMARGTLKWGVLLLSLSTLALEAFELSAEPTSTKVLKCRAAAEKAPLVYVPDDSPAFTPWWDSTISPQEQAEILIDPI